MMVVGDTLLGSGTGTLVLWLQWIKHWLVLPSWREVALPDEATSHVAVDRIPICSV